MACPVEPEEEPYLYRVTITFDTHGGSEVATIAGEEGAMVKEPDPPTKEGFTFLGWYSAETGGTRYAWPYTLSVSVTMHARWRGKDEPPPAQYTLSFDTHGGSEVAAITGSEDYPAAKPADPTREGYTFTGWYSAETGGIRYAWPYTPKADLTMHAQWWDDSQGTLVKYTLTFDANGGSAVEAITGIYGTMVDQPPEPGRTGYVFTGWYSAVAVGTRYAWPHTLERSLTMYARWRSSSLPPLDRYTITFDSRGGSEVPPITSEEDDLVAKPADPTREGYAFQGWSLISESYGIHSWPYTLKSNVTMYAHWEPVSYTIAYNLNGGTNASGTPTSYKINSADITLAAPTRTGYDFGGWYDNEACEGDAVAKIPKGSTGDKTFWATWTPTIYTITYTNLNDGTNAGANPATYTVESDDITLLAPTRPDCSFGGWYDKENVNAVLSIPKGSTGNKTYRAKWTVNTSSQPIAFVIKVLDHAGGAVTEEPFELAKPGGSKTITVAEDDAGADFAWHIGLVQIATGRSVTLSADNLSLGTHTLQVTAKYGGELYSKEITFVVKAEE
jgi:uncharacterized repeat protein (TIGR02543 family)